MKTHDMIIYHTTHATATAGLFELGVPHWITITAGVLQLASLLYGFAKKIIADVKAKKEQQNQNTTSHEKAN